MTYDDYIEKNNADISLKEVLSVIDNNEPFDALKVLIEKLFHSPLNLHSYSWAVIDRQTYCFKFTPERIFVSKQSEKKVRKHIVEKYTCISNHKKTKKETKRTLLKNKIAHLKRILSFRNKAQSFGDETDDMPVTMRYFISDTLFRYRQAFDGKFNTCCQKRMIKNMLKNKSHAIEFFNIAYLESFHDFKKQLKNI